MEDEKGMQNSKGESNDGIFDSTRTKIASITITNQHFLPHKDKNLGSDDCSMGWYPYADAEPRNSL
jgi:hypothetical protein